MSIVKRFGRPRGGGPRRILIALLGTAAACAAASPAASADPTNGTFTNPGTTAIPATGTTVGIGNPYPSTIEASGLYPNISKVTVTFPALSHRFADDIDALLVGPGGQKLLLMSDTGGNNQITNVSLTFDDAAAASLPDTTQITSGTYKPTDFPSFGGDTFPPPAPPPPFGATLSVFNGTNPNGTWKLYTSDDLAGGTGTLVGWSLKITSTPNAGRCSNTFFGTNGTDTLVGGPGGDRIIGRRGNDFITGRVGGDCLSGNSGRDRLLGGSGRDRLVGGSGRDRISGGSGRDTLRGNSGRDSISGGRSGDKISGGSGRDRLRGNSGNDRISAKDGRLDRVNCGSGRHDRARTDTFDIVVNCETVLH